MTRSPSPRQHQLHQLHQQQTSARRPPPAVPVASAAAGAAGELGIELPSPGVQQVAGAAQHSPPSLNRSPQSVVSHLDEDADVGDSASVVYMREHRGGWGSRR